MYKDILNELIKHKVVKSQRLTSNHEKILKENHDLKNQVLNITSFLMYDAPLKVRVKCIMLGISEQKYCAVCHKMLELNKTTFKFAKYCKYTCSFKDKEIRKKVKQTNLKRHGVENPMHSEKIKQTLKQTNLDRYGVECTLQSEEVKEKIKQTNLNRHGVETPFQSDVIRNKIEQTNLERRGTKNPFQSEDVKQKIKQTNLDRLGVENPSQSDEIRKKVEQTNLSLYGASNYNRSLVNPVSLIKLNDPEWLIEQHHNQNKTLTKIGEELSVVRSTVAIYLNKHGIKIKTHPQSQGERDLIQFISSIYDKEIMTNSRQIIPPYELDVYLPDLQLAFEYDGIYWHSELNGKNRSYHLNKTKRCEQDGIRLVHIFENEWLNKCLIAESRIKNLLKLNKKIYARKTVIKELSSRQSNMFLFNNHIQGICSSSIKYGLFYENELVSIMTFSKSRFNKQTNFELIRFCNALNTSVVGGASKLFKHFVKQHNPQSIISYSDKRWNTGDLYKQLGFEYQHDAPSNYFYFKEDVIQLYSRVQFQKHKLHKKLTSFDPKLTEWQNMQNNGYDRIWDCGNSVWLWKS